MHCGCRRIGNFMRLRFRLIISLIIGITVLSLLFAISRVRTEKRELRTGLEGRAQILAESLAAAVAPFFSENVDRPLRYGSREALNKRSRMEIQRLVDRFSNRERLAGVVVYDDHDQPVAMTSGLAGRLPVIADMVKAARTQDKGSAKFLRIGNEPMHVYVLPVERERSVAGALAIFHDTGFIEVQSSAIWRTTLQSGWLQTLGII